MSDQNNNFEGKLEKLEAIVKALESGDLPLDEAVKKYEEGIKLSKEAKGHLKDAENVLNKMMKSGEETSFEIPKNED